MSAYQDLTAAAPSLKKRDDFWDIIRGLLIYGVFIGHDIGGWNYITGDYMFPPYSFLFNKWILLRCVINVTVPMFVFVSGFMVHRKYFDRIRPFYVNRTVRFMMPFIVWSLIYSVIEVCVYHNEVTLTSILLGSNGIQLYFLLLMMQLVILSPLFFKIRNKKMVLIASFVINLANNVIHVIYKLSNGSKFPNETLYATSFIFFYTLGLYCRNTEGKLLKKITLAGSACLFVIGLELYMLSAYFFLLTTMDPIISVSFVTVGSLVYSTCAICFVMRLRERLRDHDYGKNVILRGLRWIGVHSMDFFLVHWVFEDYIKVWFINNVDWKYNLLANTVTIALTTILCVVCSWIADRVRHFCKTHLGGRTIIKT